MVFGISQSTTSKVWRKMGPGKNGEQMRENIFKDSKITCAFLAKTFSKIGKGFFFK